MKTTLGGRAGSAAAAAGPSAARAASAPSRRAVVPMTEPPWVNRAMRGHCRNSGSGRQTAGRVEDTSPPAARQVDGPVAVLEEPLAHRQAALAHHPPALRDHLDHLQAVA